MNLETFRKEIDRIDTELVALLLERMKLSEDIAALKIEEGMAVRDETREKALLESRSSHADSEVKKQAVREVFEAILKASRNVQHTFMGTDEA